MTAIIEPAGLIAYPVTQTLRRWQDRTQIAPRYAKTRGGLC
jgi:hypothetical protein